MNNLYIDFDGVILNTIEVSYKIMNDLDIDKKNQKLVTDFYRDLDWNDLIDRSSTINDSIECIKKIIDSKRFNVIILTHVNSLREIEKKVHFIREHIIDLPIISVPKSMHKTNMVNAKDCILIDDYVSNLEEWSKCGGIGVRFDLDKDGKGFQVIDKLDQILEMY